MTDAKETGEEMQLEGTMVTSMRDRILAAARAELAEVGPAALSMRAVSRRVGVTVGALYRYFENRDALLTELIVEAYANLGTGVAAAIEGAAGHAAQGPGEQGTGEQWADEQGADEQSAGNRMAAPESAATHGSAHPSTGLQRWVAGGLAAREWAIAHPHEFMLIYGTPVIGYEAPERTIDNATMLIEALVGVLASEGVSSLPRGGAHAQVPLGKARELGAASENTEGPDLDEALEDDVRQVREWLSAREFYPDPERVTGDFILTVIRYWTELIGTISFELSGHYRQSIDHGAAYLERILRIQAKSLGLH